MKKLFALFAVFAFCSSTHAPVKKLKPTKSLRLSMTEPSDVCISGTDSSLFIASGDRHIYEIDFNGKIIHKCEREGMDYESVFADQDFVYANDESLRKVDVYNAKTLEYVKSYPLNYNGPINKGFESLTWNATKNCYVMVSEKNPCVLYEYDKNFQLIDQIDIPQYREISAVTYFNEQIWLLSDEEETVYKVNASDYKIIDQWNVPIDNPEGIAFDKKGNLFISSDDMGRLFCFTNPQL